MTLNPLTPVTDYQSMLNRIFWFTSGASLVAVWLLRNNLPWMDALLAQIDFNLEFGGDNILPVPGSYLLPAVAIGLASRVFRIHGQIAGLLGIRRRFDIDVIIGELALRVGIDLRNVPGHELVCHRHEIMRHGFYRFVSGREPQIDEHLIHRALDLWSWFWIGIEATCVFIVTGFVLIGAGVVQLGLLVVAIAIGIAALGLPALRNECRRYAIAQVRAIVSDPERTEQVRQSFDCIARKPPIARQAA
ncbi:MAG: hypothetical protein ACR2NU_16130 [Aeoliella sp.]